MTQPAAFSVAQIAEWCGASLPVGSTLGNATIRGVETLANADNTHLSWVAGDGHERALSTTRAAAIIGSQRHVGEHPRGIIVSDPEDAIATILGRFQVPLVEPPVGIHPTAVVSDTAKLGRDVAVGPHVVIGPDATVGDHTVIFPNATVGAAVRIGSHCIIHSNTAIYDRCQLGDRVILHAGTVIGADGFGYIFRGGRHRKVPQIGIAIIEDDVEIGANSCVDRAKVGMTRIGRGSKIDNLVQVAHNVQMGQACILVAQVGVAGSTTLGNGVVAAGQSGFIDGLKIGDRVKVGAKTAVMKDVPADQVVVGSPARERSAYFRNEVRINRLASLYEQVAELKKRVAELERAANDRPPD